MPTLTISLPDDLRQFVDDRHDHGYGSSSDYIRDLIRRDRDRLALNSLIVEGIESGSAGPIDADYFKSLRAYAKNAIERHKPTT
jgi:antitoxin ParD1/3/4